MRMSPSFSKNGLPPQFHNAARNPSWRFDRRPTHTPNRLSWHSISEIDLNSSYPKLNEIPAGINRLHLEMRRHPRKQHNFHSYPIGGIPSIHKRSVSRYNMYNERSTRSPSLSLSVQQVLPIAYEHISPLSSPHMSTTFFEPSVTLPLITGTYRYPTAEIIGKATGSP